MAGSNGFHKKSKKRSFDMVNAKNKRKSKKRNFFVRFFVRFFVVVWSLVRFVFLSIFYALKWLLKIFKKSRRRPKKVVEPVDTQDSVGVQKKVLPKPNIRVLDSFKGSFKVFLSYIKKSDSFIGIVLGARGSGKSAVALTLVENIRGSNKKVFAMGFPSKSLPGWIHLIKDISQIQNDSFLIVDEGGILFSSRSSMSDANKFLSELLFVARHKNLSIIFISQNSSNLEVNTLRQADFLVLKRSSLLQKNFERKIVADIYTEYNFGFDMHSNVKGLALIYSDKYVGFIDNDLPSFWSENISKSFK